jgi:hypothetical protein
MKRFATLIALLILVALGSTGRAQERWAEKLFNGDLVHDFGTVARGAELYYRFRITNIYAVPLDISDLRVSCGCVRAESPQKTIQPKETGYIEARMDTTRFTGLKTVNIFVSIAGKGYSSSSELKVSANIRQDVVFNPGEVDFGVVNLGESAARTIDVDYAGPLAGSWKITEVVTNNAPVDAALKEVKRDLNRVGYQVVLTMKKDASVGALKHEIFLKTNDPSSPLVPAFMVATVQAAVTVKPSKLSLGSAAVGSKMDFKAVVRSSKPLRITGVEGIDDIVSIDKPPTEAADNHLLTIHCKPARAGEFKRVLKIKTDAQEAPLEVTIEGTVDSNDLSQK